GVGSAADSLFQFKSGFSKRRHEFATWRWIIAPEVYHEVTAARERWNVAHGLETNFSEFFPSYRAAGIPRAEIAAPEQNEPAIAASSAVAA
ncbi:MAG TPA: hypothetical protein VG095_08270, partial [Chthoniobacterales bacterium]|nr:hypothetical protein [Chthoniobacterales bacterium]